MNFDLEPGLEDLRRVAAAAARNWATRAGVREDSWLIGYDRQTAIELGRRGWIGMTWPVAEGGGGRTPLERFVVYEALIGNGAPIAASYFADRQIGPTLLQFGTTEQRQRWLPGILDGSSMWCIGISEPDAGSDVAGIRTTARRSRDGWVINGQKVWTSGAASADWCYLVARTASRSDPHAGLSEFVIDMTSPGITVRPIVDMTGNDHFCEVHLNDVYVPHEHLIGMENDSFKQVMRQLEFERGGVDRLLSNFALYQDVKASLTDRPLDPAFRRQISDIECGYRIGRLLVLREMLRQAPRGFSAVSKAYCTNFEQKVAQFCARALGAQSLLWGGPDLGARASRAVCYSPAYTIMGGTNEVLRNIVAERMLRLPR